jgi:hypothetical protein
MNKKILYSIGLGAITLGSLVFANNTFAYRGDPLTVGPNYTQERHEIMEKAFENKDYNAWKNLMSGRGRVTQVINQGNFAKFAEAHDLAEAGKITEANKIKSELGLGLKNGSGNGMGRYQLSR